jgi:hypothetical protein
MDNIAIIMAGLSFGVSLTLLAAINLAIKEYKGLHQRCDRVIAQAVKNLKSASEINQALSAKIDIIEDSLKVLDFYRSQGKK